MVNSWSLASTNWGNPQCCGWLVKFWILWLMGKFLHDVNKSRDPECRHYDIYHSGETDEWQWQWQWQWNNLYCQVTYKSCTESYDKDKTGNRTIIHETYRTWQRGREAIMAYVPQYQLYQRDCFFGVQSRNTAECWNSFNLMLFLSCTCMSYVYPKKNT